MSSDEGFAMDGSSYDGSSFIIEEEEEEIIEEIIEDDDDDADDNYNNHDDGHDDDYDDDDDDGENDGSLMNDILQEKLERIAVLERANRLQEAELSKLQNQANEDSVKHKQEVYFLKLELDGARRNCTAAEERMAELFDDLKHVAAMQEKNQKAEDTATASTTTDSYNYAAEVLENQISMVHTSSGEVIKTLKDEIADLMDDRCRMELDLLNQLASLDREKRTLENNMKQRLQSKDETIQRLRELSKDSSKRSATYNGELDELEEELLRLADEKKQAEELLAREREEADEMIQRLEDTNTKLQNKLEALADDLDVLRQAPDTQETVKALDRIANEREEIVSTLERVATIWEKADSSVFSLEDAMDKLRPTDNVPVKGDQERLLSTLETATLIHGQVKVALLLIEVRLRNQLQSLKNDKLSMTWAAPSDEEVVGSMREILDEGLTAISHVESTISEQVRNLEEKALNETRAMKEMIADRSKTLEGMQEDHKTLENDIFQLKSSNQDSSGNIMAHLNPDDLKSPEKPANIGISSEVVEQLHVEVNRIVERIRQKNETIETLKEELEAHKSREASLKKDLKRALKRPSKAEGRKQDGSSSSLSSPARPNGQNRGSGSSSLSSPVKPKGQKRASTGSSKSLTSPVRSKEETEKKGSSRTSPMSPKGFFKDTGDSSAVAGISTPPLKAKSKKAEMSNMSPTAGLPLSPTATKSPSKSNSSKKTSKLKSPRRGSAEKAQESNDIANGNFASPVKTPTKKLLPLLPSPREISKPRMYSPVV